MIVHVLRRARNRQPRRCLRRSTRSFPGLPRRLPRSPPPRRSGSPLIRVVIASTHMGMGIRRKRQRPARSGICEKSCGTCAPRPVAESCCRRGWFSASCEETLTGSTPLVRRPRWTIGNPGGANSPITDPRSRSTMSRGLPVSSWNTSRSTRREPTSTRSPSRIRTRDSTGHRHLMFSATTSSACGERSMRQAGKPQSTRNPTQLMAALGYSTRAGRPLRSRHLLSRSSSI